MQFSCHPMLCYYDAFNSDYAQDAQENDNDESTSSSSESEGIKITVAIRYVHDHMIFKDSGEDDCLEPIVEDESEEEMEEDMHHTQSEISGIVLLMVTFLLKFQMVYKVSDKAITALLRFFKYFIMVIGRSFSITALQHISSPLSVHGCHSLVGCTKKPFKEFIVCPTCHMLYDPEVHPLVEGTTDNKKSVLCKHIQFPYHTQQRFRMPCNTVLMNSIRKGGSKQAFRARKTYCYYGIKAALTHLLNRPTFLTTCNSWKKRRGTGTLMEDFIDGKVWLEETEKLANNGNFDNILGFLINIDWFQPFKDTSYSVGVIYAVIVNLPRDIRYKDQNVIIVGVIPGPKEPSHDINSYLGPLVSELLELYSGLWFTTTLGRQFLRGILVCIASDIPATRKAAGFVGHNGLKGCSRCLKSFTTDSNHLTDYSGYNRDSWTKRTNEAHREHAYRELRAKTKAEKKSIERKYGARYSVLFELPYYNSIRFVVIDMMHNLFLGTSKHMLNLWKELNILDTKHFQLIQTKIQTLNVPQDIGRIPYKIESGMAGMTADQWKNWTCVYSLYVLEGVIPQRDLHCWWLFVQACLLLCQQRITPEDIKRGDHFLLEFCKQHEELYGPNHCTPNMHLHCHIAECLYDYGPAHSTWCFSFERCNGILGSMPNNNKSLEIEKTMAKRFIHQMEQPNHTITNQFESELLSLFPDTSIGSVNETTMPTNSAIAALAQQLPTTELTYNNNIIVPIGPMTEHALPDEPMEKVKAMYDIIFKNHKVTHVSRLCRRFVRVKLAGTLYSSKKARTDRNSYICAYWLGDDDKSVNTETICRPGCVQYYIKQNVILDYNTSVTMYLANVHWYATHPEKYYFLSPNTLWYPDYVPLSEASFMPISRMACRCMQGEILEMTFPDRPYNNGKVIIINPIGCVNLVF